MHTSDENSNRVAVLISGQIRTSNDDLRAISKACDEINADVYICVWRKRGTKGFGGGQGPRQLGRVFGRRLAVALPRQWFGPNIRKIFEDEQLIFPDNGSFDEAGLQEIFPNAHVQVVGERQDLTIPFVDSNSLRMLFMIEQCNQMKRSKEAELKLKYDTVIRHRPDVQLDYPKAIERLRTVGKVIFPMGDARLVRLLNDVFWVAHSDEDDLLTGLYHRADETRHGGWLGIHDELRKWVNEHEIDFEMFNCVSKGILQASFEDPEYQGLVSQNFVNAVKTRQLNIEKAGGEEICAAFAQVFSALHNGEKLPSGAIAARYKLIEESDLKSDIVMSLLQSQGWFLSIDNSREARDRISSFILTISIDYLIGHKFTAESCVGFLPELFQDDITTSGVISCLSDKEYALKNLDPLNAELFHWIAKTGEQSEEELGDIVQAIVIGLMQANRNNGWLSVGLKSEGRLDLFVPYVEAMLDLGAYSRGPISQVTEFYKRSQSFEKMIEIAARGAAIDQSSFAYGFLGTCQVTADNKQAAREAFLKAKTFSDCAEWVTVALADLGEE